MSSFTPPGIELLNGQELGRLATVNEVGELGRHASGSPVGDKIPSPAGGGLG